MEADCLTPTGKECAARFVCNAKLYDEKCMKYLKQMDSKGLSACGDKLNKTNEDDK